MARPTGTTGVSTVPDGLRHCLRGPWPAALLGVLCFLNTLGNDFAYDDRPLVADNPRIHDLTDLRGLWLRDWWYPRDGDSEADPQRDRLYRPLTLFTFALNYAVSGASPAGYHVVNLALHAAVCLLAWHFAGRLTGDGAIASVMAVLFAVHPVHVEAVANVIGRSELLAALFLLIGLNWLLPRDGVAGPRRALAAALAFLAALTSKEPAVCYPAVALLVLYARHGRGCQSRRWWLMHAACLLLPLLVYLPLRYVALDHRLLGPPPSAALMNPLLTATVEQRVLGAFTVLGHYTRLLIIPARLSCDYGLAIIDPRAGFTGMTLLGTITASAALVGLAGFVRADSVRRQVAVLTALALASYVLISHTVRVLGPAVGERLMYWPSVPILTLGAAGIVQFWRRQCGAGRRLASSARLLALLGVAYVGVLGVRTVVRNRDWYNSLTLAARDVATYPQGAHLNRGYAMELMRQASDLRDPAAQRRQLELADAHLVQALKIEPAYPGALGLRARILAHFGDVAGATACAQSALFLSAYNRDALIALAQLEHPGEDPEQRVAALRVAADEHPDDAGAQLALGTALLDAGQPGAARVPLARAAAALPDNVDALQRLGQAQAVVGRDNEAIETFGRILALRPDDWSAHANVARLLVKRDPAAALQHAKRAHELAPDDLSAASNLAEVYMRTGQRELALELLRQIEQRLPEDGPFRKVVRERIRTVERR